MDKEEVKDIFIFALIAYLVYRLIIPVVMYVLALVWTIIKLPFTIVKTNRNNAKNSKE